MMIYHNVTYAWVLEEALDRGLHAHAVIYVNGQQHRSKWGFKSLLQRLWEEITDGEGYLKGHSTPEWNTYKLLRCISSDLTSHSDGTDLNLI